jgi:tryptophan-rich sensory protein
MTTQLEQARAGRNWWRIALVTVPVVLGLGMLSGWLSNSGFSNGWFVRLDKPAFMPPGWVFGAVWTLLYTLMGIALALVIAAPQSAARRLGLALFAAQLLLNFAWSPTFFGGGMIDAGMLIILALDLLVAALIVVFWRTSPLAGALLLPYLAWLCLASALNWEIGRLNPGADTAPLGITGA